MKFIAQLSAAAVFASIVAAVPSSVDVRGEDCGCEDVEETYVKDVVHEGYASEEFEFDAKFGTGYIPSGIESCISHQMGPYFMNPMYQNAPGGGAVGEGAPGGGTPGLGGTGCFSCLLTVAKELPCIAKAISTSNPLALLGCGVGKPDICQCLECLPGAVYKYVASFCESNEGEGVEPTLEFADNDFIANADVNVKAFLGLLTPEEVDAIKNGEQPVGEPQPPVTGQPGGNQTGDGQVGGPNCIGSKCGSCDCCVGLCIFGVCGGICA